MTEADRAAIAEDVQAKVLTVLEFADRFEGQCIHRGTLKSCEELAEKISAISYSGGEKILNSALRIVPDELPIEAGARYRCMKGT